MSHNQTATKLINSLLISQNFKTIFQDPATACVTAAVIRYQTLDQDRTGVTTTFLQDRLKIHQSCPVFISHNPDFRLPEDVTAPVVMIGPGTGVAPFRAFIQERGGSQITMHNKINITYLTQITSLADSLSFIGPQDPYFSV